MRVERALDKLRAAFARRGVTSTGAALAAVLASQAGAAAPVGMAGAITSAALAGVGVGAGGAAVGVGILFMSKTTTTILIGAVLVASGTALYQWTEAQRAETELAALRVERDGLRSQFAAEQQRSRRSTQEAIALQTQVDVPAAPPVATPESEPPPAAPSVRQLSPEELMVFRRISMNSAINNNLRVLYNARERFQREHGHFPASLDDVVGEGKYIPALVAVNGEDYSALPLTSAQPLSVRDREGTNMTYDPSAPRQSPQELPPVEQHILDFMEQMRPAIGKATEAYRAANNGAVPTDPSALLPYFATPQESTAFANWLSVAGAIRGN
jgi:hypothetical protein